MLLEKKLTSGQKMEDRKPQLNDYCPHCEEKVLDTHGKLNLIGHSWPYSEAHLCCSNCSSTYTLNHEVLYQEEINSLAVQMHDVLEAKLKEIGMSMKREVSDMVYDDILRTIDRFGTGDYRNHN